MLEIDSLTKRFDSVTAVHGLTLTARPGEVLGFLGPNGAGKTTTMKMVTGFLTPDSGTARICGHDITTATLQAQRKLGYLPEGAPAYGEMTPREFLDFIAGVRGLKGAAATGARDQAVAHTRLESVLDRPIETLSKGFRRRVGLAQAILHDPEVLILDEPTDGLDPNQKHTVRELIRAIAPTKTIVISTHLLEEVDAVCSRAVIIDRGVIVADGTPAELAARGRNGKLEDLFRSLTHGDLAGGSEAAA
jgi:ABC-2 type transport system ATP-binding protein